MKSAFYLCMLLLATGCQPEKATEQLSPLPSGPESSALEQVADSVLNTRIDGTATTSTYTLDPKQQLPAALEVHLDRTHGLWQLPTLSQQDQDRIPSQAQGPYFVQANFNQDRQPDYAVQIVEKDSVSVYVFLKNDGPEEFEQHLLERYPVQKIDGKKQGNWYLTLAPGADQNTEKTSGTKKNQPADKLQIGQGDSITEYGWENGKLKKLTGGS